MGVKWSTYNFTHFYAFICVELLKKQQNTFFMLNAGSERMYLDTNGI